MHQRPTIFFLHALGASADAWSEVVEHIDGRYTCMPLDLPGFGAQALDGRTDTTALTDWFCDTVRRVDPVSWIVVGHSMGGKIATATAWRASRGEVGLAGLAGVVLLAGSPPSPEPMDPERRRTMLGWVQGESISRTHAATFVSDNVAGRLGDAQFERAVADVMRSDPAAWRAWLETGSKQDLSTHVGALPYPACVVAGQCDGDLGASAQAELNLPHYPLAGAVTTLAQAAHLLPLERPQEVAALINRLAASAFTRALPGEFLGVLNAARTDPRMRARLIARNLPPDVQAPGALDAGALAVLAAIAARVVDEPARGQELARRIDIGLAAGEGDGWRFAELPPDGQAWTQALACLQTLAGDFCALPPQAQIALLKSVQDGTADLPGDSPLSGNQLRLWFQDACAQIARVWTSLPATMAAMGYDGFSVSVEGGIARGYDQVGQDQAEAWQLGGHRA